MTDLDRLLREFNDEHERGTADPQRYLAQVSGRDRLALETMIDAYLEAAPRRTWDEQAFAASRAASVAEQIEDSVFGVSGAWPTLLPRLRMRAQIARDDLTRGLAEALGVGDRADKVHSYYHQMERGSLPPEGVSQRVLDALGKLLGVSGERLREAGSAGPGGSAAPAMTFARSAPAPLDALAQRTDAPRDAEDFDEVDQLFRAGD